MHLHDINTLLNLQGVMITDISKPRHVRHLPIWGNITTLILPIIRLSCKCCNLNFTWIYSFVALKSRYSNDFKQELSDALDGATVKQAYWFKEQLIHWYDYANKGNALYLLDK
ncbi:MAG: transposase family protein [Cellulosilyticaceae bacterium]